MIEAIKASDLTNKEQNDLIKKLKDIWKGKSELSESEQRQVLSEAAVILYDYLGIDQPAEVGILWYQKAHAGLARIAAQKMGIPATYLNLIESEASI
ncbi:MAG: hypothetical protein QMD78_06885 [Methanocellales archaeon]|nr:hypothetical protein [Methanocellales archaeon]